MIVHGIRRALRPVVLAALASSVTFGATFSLVPAAVAEAEPPQGQISEIYRQLDLFGDIFERIRATYVDEVSDEDLIRAAIDGMLASLDPHSSYLPPQEYEAMRSRTQGSFGGVGLELREEAGQVTVVTAMEGTPAARAGLQPGDVISHVDGTSLAALGLREATSRMRGEIGTAVRLTVLRGGELLDIEIVREAIRSQAVRSSLDGGVMVLRVIAFNRQTQTMLEEAFAQRSEEAGGVGAVDGIVIDLRNNPGGLLDQAIRVTNSFLDDGEIVSTRSRTSETPVRFQATAGDLAAGKPIVVLINGRSASASEIVAGALQDNGRAMVVGTQSFGKGSVQTISPIRRDGAIKLTTSRYYTPSGRSIQARGIVPDVIIEAEAGAEDDAQLGYAVDLVRGLALIRRPPVPVLETAEAGLIPRSVSTRGR